MLYLIKMKNIMKKTLATGTLLLALAGLSLGVGW